MRGYFGLSKTCQGTLNDLGAKPWAVVFGLAAAYWNSDLLKVFITLNDLHGCGALEKM
jgi:hypothetical protein